LIEPPRYFPAPITVHGIGSIENLIKQEIDKNLNTPIFVEVVGYAQISVYSTFGERYERQELYTAISDVPKFDFGWKDYDSAMIALRSQFEQTEETEYILGLLSRITDDNSATTSDNGLSQTVEVRQGVSLKQKENVKPRVKLTPFRTFREIGQPESEFLLRIREGGQIGIIEADNGMWKQEAKKRIAGELSWRLDGLIDAGKVVVMF
jgi:hypothetical protein